MNTASKQITRRLSATIALVVIALYYAAVLMVRLRAEILRRERDASWLRTGAGS